MSSQGQKNATTEVEGPVSADRRALLRGTIKAMPVVLTLQSGAALARSSNLIGPAAAGTRDVDGNTLCLDTTDTEPQMVGEKYDLGEPARGTVNVLADNHYVGIDQSSSFSSDSDDGDDDDEYDDDGFEDGRIRVVGTDEMCRNGGSYHHYKYGVGWQEVRLPANGVVVSATAVLSVSAQGDILINRIG